MLQGLRAGFRGQAAGKRHCSVGGLAGHPGDQGSGEVASPHVHVGLGHPPLGQGAWDTPSLLALTLLPHVRGSE